MNRRSFLTLGGVCAVSLPALPFQEDKSKLKITGVRIVQTRPKRPVPSYTPAPASRSTRGVEVANPRAIDPEYKAARSLWNPELTGLALRCRFSTRKQDSMVNSGGTAP